MMYMASINSLHGMPMWHSIYLVIDVVRMKVSILLLFKLLHMAFSNSLHGMPMLHFINLVVNNGNIESKLVIDV
jgi:hypothetical protein